MYFTSSRQFRFTQLFKFIPNEFVGFARLGFVLPVIFTFIFLVNRKMKIKTTNKWGWCH